MLSCTGFQREGSLYMAQCLASWVLVICCRFSIHVTDSQPGETRAAVEGMPMLVPGGLQSVFHCGFSSEVKLCSTVLQFCPSSEGPD